MTSVPVHQLRVNPAKHVEAVVDLPGSQAHEVTPEQGRVRRTIVG